MRQSNFSPEAQVTPLEPSNPSATTDGAAPRVSVIVWHEQTDYALPLATLLASASYPNLEIITVGAPGAGSGYHDLDRARLKVVAERPVTWATACNAGARLAEGEFLLFADETLTTRDPAWLPRLLAPFEDSGVGAVGPTLLRPDGRAHSLGYTINREGEPEPILHGVDMPPAGKLDAFDRDREVSAVSGKALCVRRTGFETLSGFRQDYVSSYADIDLCLRLGKLQSRVIVTAQPRMTVHERSQRLKGQVWDRAFFVDAWRRQFSDGDPLYNAALDDGAATFRRD